MFPITQKFRDWFIKPILDAISDLKKEEIKMALDLTGLTTQVTANTQVEASAITLIQGLASQISASAGDQAAVTALASQLNSSATALAAAITANTSAAPVSGS